MKTKFLAFLFVFQMTFSGAQNKAVFTVQADKPTAKVASTMWGAFFEDINFGADGGLYAELVKNRSFEFANPMTGWTIHNSKIFYGFNLGSDILIQNRSEKESTNPRYMHLNLNNTDKDSLGLTNEGFHGMGIKKGLRYDFSVMYRQTTANAKLNVQLINEKGEIIASGIMTPEVADNGWHKAEISFTATATVLKAKLNIWFGGKGAIDLDMISLFPTDTWKGRKGGLRADMVQILADMKPGFIRFPGGCIVEGRDLSKRYQWKKSIGPVEDRKLIINRWNDEVAGRPAPDYYQSFGLGFFEYFQLAEDIGAQPLPILNCGMACQFNSAEMVTLDDLDPYVQDALDLIEFANGSVDSQWGKIRADLGHPASFNLQVLGIGNENWGSQYVDRLKVFQQAIKAKYPAIKLVSSSGLVLLGEAYEYTNKEVRKLKVDYVDEHYYNNSQWFLDNVRRYDNYDRKSETKVFVGEYAAQSEQMGSQNNKNNWRTALSEAAYMTGLERNADIVEMAGYAPLFAHVEGWQWKPDLIWVDNLHVMGTPNYYVQKLYANNRGNVVVPILNNNQPVTGQDSLYASSTIDKTTNELIVKIANIKKSVQSAELIINGVKKIGSTAKLTILQNDNLEAENSLEFPSVVVPVEKNINTKGKTISVALKGNSFFVIRVKI